MSRRSMGRRERTADPRVVPLENFRQLSSFTRSGEAAAVDPRNGWAWYNTTTPWPGTDVPRVLSDGAILIEGARTNRVLRSYEIENAGPWAQNGATVTTGQTGPDGLTNARRVQSAAGTRLSPEQTYAADVGAIRVTSVYAAKGVGSGYYTLLGFDATHFNFPDHYAAGTASAAWSRVILSPASLCSRTYVNDGRGSVALTGGGAEAAQDTDALLYLVVAEDGSFATTPIRTTTAEVTRAGDFAALSSMPARMRIGNSRLRVWPEFSSATAPATAYIRYLDANNFLALISGTTLRVRANGVNYDVTPLAYSALASMTIDLRFGAGTVAVNNGAPVAVGNNWGGASGAASIGSDGAANHFFGAIAPAVPT